MRLWSWIARYHRFAVRGIENIPLTGACIVATTHSAVAYELALLYRAIYRERRRLLRVMAARYQLDGPLGPWLSRIGPIPAFLETGRAVLARGGIVGVAPGGTHESLRPTTERYRIDWRGRRGFVRLALETGTPVILAACPAADRIYTVYSSPLVRWVYDRYRLPLRFVRGLGPTIIPRPVRLTFHLSAPVHPPALVGSRLEDADVEAFFARLEARMHALIADALT